uniref:Uncharacterized protein n=1 Tax=Tanacetum cinerariifolium TaxID=118510 RepID=A0A6L2K3R1_TANCI|nr:hypothetical protein [Tanacetum cinerariifolium]
MEAVKAFCNFLRCQNLSQAFDKLESSPWLDPRYGENMSLFFCPLLLSQEGFFLDLLKPSLLKYAGPHVNPNLQSIFCIPDDEGSSAFAFSLLNVVYCEVPRNGMTKDSGEGDGVSNWTSSGVIGKMSMEEEEVSLVDGVFEGALGALALEMEALVDAMVVYGG